MFLYVDKDGLSVHAVESLVDGSDVYGSNYLLTVDGKEVEVNFRRGIDVLGLTNEALLTILIHRLTVLDNKQPCSENELAIKAAQTAFAHLQAREQRLRPDEPFSS